MNKRVYIIIIMVISLTFPASNVNAAAYSVAGKNGGVFLEYADIEVFFPSDWAAEHVKIAERLGLGFPSRIEKYNRKLTRKELAHVSVNLFSVISGESVTLTDKDRNSIAKNYTDSYKNGKLLDDEVFLAIKHNLMYGTSSNTFSPDGLVTREQTAAVLYRIIERFMDMSDANRADLTKFTDYDKISSYALDCLSIMVGEEILSGTGNSELSPQNVCTYEEVLAIAVRFAQSFEEKLNANLYGYNGAILNAPQVLNVHTSEIEYQGKQTSILDGEWAEIGGAIGYAVDCKKPDGTVLRTLTANTGVTIFESDIFSQINVYSIGQSGSAGLLGEHGSSLLNPVLDESDYAGIYVYNDYASLINAQNESDNLIAEYNDDFDYTNPRNITQKRYSSNAEALADMTEITVPIWKMGQNSTRIASNATFYVHRAVAQDVIGIFNEIFNGPEQFPIYAVAGYNWRGASSKSSHNQGLAIDINPDHNYFINTKGKILSGKVWDPALSPYSIKPDGDVVRAFNKYGWFWGGIGWSTTGKDYMHFSYTGV